MTNEQPQSATQTSSHTSLRRLSTSHLPSSASPFPSPSSSFLPPPVPGNHEFANKANWRLRRRSSATATQPAAAAGQSTSGLTPPATSTSARSSPTYTSRPPSQDLNTLMEEKQRLLLDPSSTPTPTAEGGASDTPVTPTASSSSSKPPKTPEPPAAATTVPAAQAAFTPGSAKHSSISSLTSSRPAPPSPAPSRRTSVRRSMGGGADNVGLYPPPSPSSAKRLSTRSSINSNPKRSSLLTPTALSSSFTASSPPHPPPTRKARLAPIKVRDFAFPSQDERHLGMGPDAPRRNRKVARMQVKRMSTASSTSSTSSSSSAASSRRQSGVFGNAFAGMSWGSAFAKWGSGSGSGSGGAGAGMHSPSASGGGSGVGPTSPSSTSKFSWLFGRSSSASSSSQQQHEPRPSQSDFERNFDSSFSSSDSNPLSNSLNASTHKGRMTDPFDFGTSLDALTWSSSSSSNENENEDDLELVDAYAAEPEDEHGDYGYEQAPLDPDAPLVAGIYRALYSFEPEGTAEMGLEEDQLLRILGRGGGVGWAVAVRGWVGGPADSQSQSQHEGGGSGLGPNGEVDPEKCALVPESYLELVKADEVVKTPPAPTTPFSYQELRVPDAQQPQQQPIQQPQPGLLTTTGAGMGMGSPTKSTSSSKTASPTTPCVSHPQINGTSQNHARTASGLSSSNGSEFEDPLSDASPPPATPPELSETESEGEGVLVGGK